MNKLVEYLKPSGRHGRVLGLLAVLLLIGSTMLGLSAWETFRASEKKQARQQRLLAMQAKRIPPKPTRQEEGEQKRWAELKQERDFNWDQVFIALERTVTPSIALLEFEPDKRNKTIVLRGEAKDRKSLTNFVANLAQQASLDKVHLVHQQNISKDRLETISFEIKAGLVTLGSP